MKYSFTMGESKSYEPKEHFPRKVAEEAVTRRISDGSRLFLVLAPDLAGKRWVMEHVLHQMDKELRTLWIDARSVQEPADAALQLASQDKQARPHGVTTASDLSRFVETFLDRPTMIVWRHVEALDEAERYPPALVRHAIREWATAGAYKESFGRLQQAILSSKPGVGGYYFYEASGERVDVPDLDAAETETFARRLGVPLSSDVAKRLWRVIGGHIYFLRLALLDRAPGVSIEELCNKPLHPRGPFRDMYARFVRRLDGVTREERAGVRLLLESGLEPRGSFAEELVDRGVFERGRPGIRYRLFEAFLKEYFSS